MMKIKNKGLSLQFSAAHVMMAPLSLSLVCDDVKLGIAHPSVFICCTDCEQC